MNAEKYLIVYLQSQQLPVAGGNFRENGVPKYMLCIIITVISGQCWTVVGLCFSLYFLLRCMEWRRGLAMRSVYLSNAWFEPKGTNDVSRFLYHTKDHLG